MDQQTFINLFKDDAFSALTLSASISNIDSVPGAAGQYAFDGVAEGVPTTAVAIERVDEELKLIPENPRGAPPPQENKDKSKLFSFSIPHFPLEASIHADEVQGVPNYAASVGATNPHGFQVATVDSVVDDYLRKIASRMDLTQEFLRLGAIKGEVIGGSGAVLVDLFEEFEIQNSDGQYAPETFGFDLESYAPQNDVRITCQNVTRFMARNLKSPLPRKAYVIAFCGDNFFDRLIEHPSVKGVFAGRDSAIERLGGNFAGGEPFEVGGIVFMNYVGSDDNATVAIATDEARFFYHGVPELFAEYYAPADFIDAANHDGLPRYARIAPDTRFNQRVFLHAQMNPLPLCLRPKTLVRGTVDGPND